jgi:signal transduction histidine kinase
VQDYQNRLAVERLSEVAMAASFAGRQLEAREARPDEIGSIIASQLIPANVGHVRVLVVDGQGRIHAEQPPPSTARDLTFSGRRIDLPVPGEPAPRGTSTLRLRTRATVWTDESDRPGRQFIFVTAPIQAQPVQSAQPAQSAQPPQPGAAVGAPGTLVGRQGSSDGRGDSIDRFTPRQAAYRVVLAVPEGDLRAAWRELIPSLALALGASVLASVAVAFWLSRSITRPLRQITRAAQDIARGRFRQSIPVRGRDEVAQLAASFNTMSEEVERSHRALREFLANASHELRTPLTSIQGFSQALVDGTLTGAAGASQAGEIINEEANRMRRLVEDLLYLSRVESQDVPAIQEEVDLAALVREGLRRVQHAAEQRALRFDARVGELPPVIGDADQLDRVFGNLLDNAVKYTPEGSTITVSAAAAAASTPASGGGASATAAPPSGGVIRVAVHNSGTAIPEEDLPHIFERFYRVDKSRAREVEGSGLGLAIAREVVERHGGAIEVRSTADDGTTFVVTLPAAGAAAPARAAGTPRLQPASA